MTRATRPAFAAVLAVPLALAANGCATFATNVEGDFSCRAPKGTCAPSHAIDAGATSALQNYPAAPAEPRIRAGVGNVVSGGDTARTAERTLKIVFPAHVDEGGTLHDEAVAWAVIENPRWAAELRRKPGEENAPPLMRQLKRQLQSAEAADASIAGDPAAETGAPATDDPAAHDSLVLDWTSPFSLSPTASPLVLPSTAREAVAGAHAPAVEGVDMSPPPDDRTPRPQGDAPELIYPSPEAIEAARSKAAEEAKSPAVEEEAE
jgi:conjugal transfer pilus assembly protein TraV